MPDKKNAQAFYGHKKMWCSEAWEPLGDLAERNPKCPNRALPIL